MNKYKRIKKVRKSELIPDDVANIYEDEVYRMVVEHDKKELERVKKEFKEKYQKLKNSGNIDFLGFA